MDNYLHNRLIKLIAPKSLMEVESSVPYDCNIPGVLSPKKINESLIEIVNFNFGEDKGLKKVINYFKFSF
jgi:hypothetical protein